ncbi:MAG TPA: malto-oligosyltrehalose trehalohydrolase [Kofleriaceae bacterium]|nr:malto-oligosyltrehalose trehalohydrolase [Kofleriaceae bacterium]
MLGAHVHDAGTTFRLWSPPHARCAVRLYDDAGGHRDVAMDPQDGGYHQATAGGVGHGARYRFVLDGDEVNDPYARFLPEGVDAPAMVCEARHRWQHAPVHRPLAEQVLYELHVGTFTGEGTYAAAAARLPDLVDLGVTTVELLPVAAFGGRHGWGYDGVAHYAPHAAYGTPDELRALVDAAHGLGLAVLLDVVYNHFGPAGNVLRRYSPAYFTRDFQNAWGEAPDYRVPEMRAYAVDNVGYWLDAFRLDGLRFDAVHAIADPSERHVVRDLVARARACGRPVTLIAEDERNDPSLVTDVGFDAVWADDLHHAVHVTLTGEQDGYYAGYAPGVATIARTIERGWLYEGQWSPTLEAPRGAPADALPARAFVYCLQNHDQVGNRALGDRLSALVSADAYAAATALLLFLPMTLLLFQGEEWAASTPFAYFTDHDAELGRLVSEGRRREFARFAAFADDAARARIPDPQAAATFAGSKLRWDERARAPHARVLALHRELLRLRARDPVLRDGDRRGLAATTDGDLLVVTRRSAAGVRVLYLNAGASARPVPWAPNDRVLLATAPGAAAELPAWSAVLVATGAAGAAGAGAADHAA